MIKTIKRLKATQNKTVDEKTLFDNERIKFLNMLTNNRLRISEEAPQKVRETLKNVEDLINPLEILEELWEKFKKSINNKAWNNRFMAS